ncbi:glycosyltransferase [Chromobacterium violaceum]|uniref:glycosyltransferase n=1 Tax=Chromobacterium violaceum TaxID=536 RepID=UPI0009D9AE98|nr:glycosyltransferase [Chromobacterium violaceum]
MKYVMVSSISDGGKSGAVSVAGEIAQLGIINGFNKLENKIDKIFSYSPNRLFPNGPLIYKGGLSNVWKTEICFLPYINLPVIKWISLNVILFFKLIAFAKKDDVVFFYNYSYPSGWAGLVGKLVKKYKLFAIIFDIHVPGQTVKNSIRWKFEYFTYKYLLPKTDKIVVISNEIAKDFSPVVPSLLVEGGISPHIIQNIASIEYKSKYNKIPFKIGFAGRLDDDNCVAEILRAADILEKKGIPVEFNIVGNGKYFNEVKQAASVSRKIIFHGQVTHTKSIEIMKQQHLNLCIRATKKIHTRYFFPSKLLEYLFLGVPVLTTNIPFSQGEMQKYAFVLDGEEAEDISKAILEIINCSLPNIQDKLAECDKIKQEFFWDSQVSRIQKFFQGVDFGE